MRCVRERGGEERGGRMETGDECEGGGGRRRGWRQVMRCEGGKGRRGGEEGMGYD